MRTNPRPRLSRCQERRGIERRPVARFQLGQDSGSCHGLSLSRYRRIGSRSLTILFGSSLLVCRWRYTPLAHRGICPPSKSPPPEGGRPAIPCAGPFRFAITEPAPILRRFTEYFFDSVAACPGRSVFTYRSPCLMGASSCRFATRASTSSRSRKQSTKGLNGSSQSKC
jgi:hypothetical protein